MAHQDHGGGGCGHAGCNHGPAPEDVVGQWDLHMRVDTTSLRALNAEDDAPETLARAFKPHSERFVFDGDEPPVRSNEDDAELLLYVPFDTNVNITSLAVVGARGGGAPAELRCFVNVNDLDFESAGERKPTQKFDLSEELDARLEYPTEARKWQGVHEIWMHVPRNYAGEDSATGIWYIGFKVRRHSAVPALNAPLVLPRCHRPCTLLTWSRVLRAGHVDQRAPRGGGQHRVRECSTAAGPQKHRCQPRNVQELGGRKRKVGHEALASVRGIVAKNRRAVEAIPPLIIHNSPRARLRAPRTSSQVHHRHRVSGSCAIDGRARPSLRLKRRPRRGTALAGQTLPGRLAPRPVTINVLLLRARRSRCGAHPTQQHPTPEPSRRRRTPSVELRSSRATGLGFEIFRYDMRTLITLQPEQPYVYAQAR